MWELPAHWPQWQQWTELCQCQSLISTLLHIKLLLTDHPWSPHLYCCHHNLEVGHTSPTLLILVAVLLQVSLILYSTTKQQHQPIVNTTLIPVFELSLLCNSVLDTSHNSSCVTTKRTREEVYLLNISLQRRWCVVSSSVSCILDTGLRLWLSLNTTLTPQSVVSLSLGCSQSSETTQVSIIQLVIKERP